VEYFHQYYVQAVRSKKQIIHPGILIILNTTYAGNIVQCMMVDHKILGLVLLHITHALEILNDRSLFSLIPGRQK
jgi:hypothetical protein